MADSIDDIRAGARRAASAANKQAEQIEMELVRFKAGDKTIPFSIDVNAETVWATQQQIADLFERDRSTIAEHIQNIFNESELDEKSVFTVNDYPVFAGYKDYLKERAIKHAVTEYARFAMRLKKDGVQRIERQKPTYF